MAKTSNYVGLPVISAEKAGFYPPHLDAAVQFAVENESGMKRDIGAALKEGHF